MLLLASSSASVRAQDEGERAGQARGSYAWGGNRAAEPEDPLRIVGYTGAGIGIRLLANLDPPFHQDFVAPAYWELGGAVYFPGAELRHGVGLSFTTNLTPDGTMSGGIQPGSQWVITPSYHLLVPLRRLIPDLGHDWVSIQGRVGIPLVFGAALGGGGGTDFSLGGELAAAVLFKFLAGFGLYVELQAAVFGGGPNPTGESTVHPMLGIDGGLLIDYEVLP